MLLSTFDVSPEPGILGAVRTGSNAVCTKGSGLGGGREGSRVCSCTSYLGFRVPDRDLDLARVCVRVHICVCLYASYIRVCVRVCACAHRTFVVYTIMQLCKFVCIICIYM